MVNQTDIINQWRDLGENPEKFYKTILGKTTLWDGQREIMNALLTNDRVAVQSGHALGKDYIASCIAMWFLYTKIPSIVILTAPCYDDKTEILTKDRGWVLFDDLVDNDKVATLENEEMVYRKPSEIFRFPYDGNLIDYNGRDLKFSVTPNHRCPVKIYGSPKGWQIKEAHEIYGKHYVSFKRDFNWNGNKTEFTNEQYEFFGMWLADGYVRYGGEQRRCDITITQSKYVDETRRIMKAFGKKVWEKKRTDSGYNFTIYGKELAKFFVDEFTDGEGKANRKIPQWIKFAEREKLKHLIHGFMLGDGSFRTNKLNTNRMRIYGNKVLAEGLFEVSMKAGYIPNFHTRKTRKRTAIFKDGRKAHSSGLMEYDITLLSDNQNKREAKTNKKDWGTHHHKGFVYCVKVPSGIIMVRKNGVHHWNGNTERQVSKVMWGELIEKWNNAIVPLPGRMLTQELIVDEKNKWYAIGFTTKDTNKAIGKFQGFHSPNILVVLSEAQAVERQIWNQTEGLMTSGNAKLLAIANPLVNYGAFYEACQPRSGYKVIRLDCEDSPNVKEGREIIPGMCSKKWVDSMAEKYGREHPVYRMKVRGIFPQISQDVPIDSTWIEFANTTAMDLIPADGFEIVGVDVARGGDNKTVMVHRKGMKVNKIDKYEKKTTMETANLIVELLIGGVYQVRIDVGGMGIGVYDRVVEMGYGEKIIPFNFGGKVIDESMSDREGVRKKDRFADMGTMAWYGVAKFLENRKMAMPFDEDLNMQLLTRMLKELPSGKLKLEPKDEYCKVRGYDSPDEADALVMCYADVSNIPMAKKPESDEEEDETLNEIYA